MATGLETPDHHGSHSDLLWTPDGTASGKVDAIIVPTNRTPAYLDTAAGLAARLGCSLVTLHSGMRTSARQAAGRIGRDVSLIAVDIPDPSALRLMDFETSTMLAGTKFARKTDTSAKRNLALLLAYTIGWQRIVFLDDDIIVHDPCHLERAVGLLDDYHAVGLRNAGYPDNSVVCHAFRLIGGGQESFIGGGALAVQTSRHMSFFPDIYNEDWFYLLDPEKGIQPLAVAGDAEQRPYDPFRNDDRARREEFGDVLAEGIFWLLDQGRPLDAADSAHWCEFLLRRKRFIEYVIARLDRAPVSPAERLRMNSALRASLGRLALIEPDFCRQYLKAWIRDRARWERHLRTFRYDLPPEEALKTLSAKGHSPLTSVVRRTPAPADKMLAAAGV